MGKRKEFKPKLECEHQLRATKTEYFECSLCFSLLSPQEVEEYEQRKRAEASTQT